MNNKTLAILSYITIIGWLVSFFLSKPNRDKLVSFHLEQALGLAITTFVVGIVLSLLASILTVIAYVAMAVYLIFFIFIIIGVLNAAKEEEKPLPIIGDFFVGKCGFLKN